MNRRLSSLVIAVAAGIFAPFCGHAQNLDAQRPQVAAALEAASRGQLDASQAAAIRNHPVYGWVELASMQRDMDAVSNAQAQDFLRRYQGQAVADSFRSLWLAASARREDWSAFSAAWQPSDSIALRCADLSARQANGKLDQQWTRDAQAIWREGSKSLPDGCDPVFAQLATQGDLSPQLRWQRIDAAAAEQQTGVMRAAARGLPANEAAQATAYAAFIDSPNASALSWPKDQRSREMAAIGLAKLARKDPDSAERQLPQFAQALGMDQAQQGQVLYQIALWTVASYLPDSARRLNNVPEASYDERLHEWRVREALSRGDWKAAQVALRKMPKSQREDSRWRYFEARMAEKNGDAAEAKRLFAEAAKSATFHGFLAADKLSQPYALCPWQPRDSAAAQKAVASEPALVRAMELWKLEKPGWAVAEWKDAMSRFNDDQRRMAVEVAQDNGWFDRAVFALGKTPQGEPRPQELRLYHLRFPLHHDATIRREAARNALDPAWVAAEIRAESIFNPKARSPANAMGLMQVLPTTGAATASKIGMPWGGAASLYDADTNIRIGSAYLRQMEDKYGMTYVAIAAYNAGPAPTARWQSQRPGFDPDIWIETVSYKETREYIARVLAFSVLYDWRLNGDALPLSQRMLGRMDGKRKAFTCSEGSGGGSDT
ncbi:transglycosylase SLT domain-containing protein [Pseudoxanthomonas dokdonensis]|uniref:Lytic murein transglycosylase n=1 Tax=Pseudoxanthomonas dokdonensis TaxID=344882 RepID=A0A0R0CH45_9GAMM|nr:transglycosylase SLT domain-containing protein [Pseudoxanthomonas dokdonensis]KRG68422.1 lytic murein transglycosylase [Pseudoxanthomonas dokdonensis]